MVRSEAARSLGKIRGDAALAALVQNAQTAHPKVRRAIAGALGAFRTDKSVKLLSKLAKKDPSYLVEAEASRALGRTRQKGVKSTLLALVDRESWADVTRAGALDGLGQLGDEETVDDVMTWTRYGVPTRGRRAAIAALARISDERRVQRCLVDLLDDDDPHLRVDVVNALEQIGDPRSRGALSRRLAHELDGRVARRIREALRDLGDSSARERRRVNEELETVKNELAELKVRLTKLEGGKQAKSEAPTPAKKKKKKKKTAHSEKAARAPARKTKVDKPKAKKAAKRRGVTPRRRKILDERGSG